AYALSDLLRTGFLLVPVVLAGGLGGLLAGAVAFGALRFGAALRLTARELRGELHPDGALFRRQLAYALPFELAVLLDIAQANYHQYAVAHRFDAATFAIYSVGCLQVPLVDLIAGSVCNVMMVRMGELRRDGGTTALLSTWHETTRRLAAVFVPLVGLLLVTSRDLVTFLFTDAYAASVPVFRVWTVTFLLAALPLDGLLRVFADTRAFFAISAAKLLIIAATTGWLLSGLGLTGAVAATVIAACVAKGLALARMRRLMGLRLEELLPWRSLGVLLGCGAAAAVPAFLAASVDGMPVPVRLAAAGLAYAAVYGALLLRFGVRRPVSDAVSARRVVPRPAAAAGCAPLKVALVAASLEILGGHGIQGAALADGLRREGTETALIPINPPFPPGLRWLRRLPFARTLLNQILFLPSLARLRHYDVAHVFSASYWSFLLAPLPAILAARLFGRRLILHYHSGEAADHLGRWGALVHPWLRLADAIVVPSHYLRGVFERHGHRVRVIPNVVDASRFRFRERRPLRPRLLSIRNLEPHYGVDNTLRAFAILRERHPDATLTVAGYGSEERRLRRLARSLGDRGIRFAGRVEPDAVPELYDGADVFVNSSLVDNQPVSVLEAFAAGLVVVTTPTGDIAAMVRDGGTGRLVPPGDPGAMAAAIADLLDSPERALLMTRRARREVEEYAWPAVRAAWASVYAGGRAA
ncbi:MAG: glycosyltransferase, partial [Candidatus Polarisedimenticolia bacterium]